MSMAMDTDVETWENTSRGRVQIRRFNDLGRERVELISGGRKFHLTPRDRRLNQEMCADPSMDMFTNGLLRPVRLIEGDEEAEKFISNPNHLSENEMTDLIHLHYKKFDEKLSEITNTLTVERILEIAEREETGATVRTVKKLQERMAELDPSQVEIREPIDAGGNEARAGAGMRPVTLK